MDICWFCVEQIQIQNGPNGHVCAIVETPKILTEVALDAVNRHHADAEFQELNTDYLVLICTRCIRVCKCDATILTIIDIRIMEQEA